MSYSITDRIDNITEIPQEYQSVVPPIPKSVKIELTARCDFQCFFCATHKRLRVKSDMDFEFYKRVVQEMRDEGVEELGVFYLGESFLCSWLPDAIKYAKDIGFPYVFLTTNGKLAKKDKVKEVLDAGLDSLKFSFNNADEEQFQSVTKVAAKHFHTIIQNIKDAWALKAEYGYDCGIFASSIQYDGEQQQKMEEAVAEILPYVDEHYYLPLYGQAGLTSGERGTAPVAGNPGRLEAMRKPIPCWAIFTEGHITYDGRLSACCFDHDGRFNMGDLTTVSFKDAWHSRAFQELRAEHLKHNVCGTVCEKCIAYE